MPVSLRVLILISIAGNLPSGISPAEEWSQFRGPDGQGHSSSVGLPVHWSPTKNVKWHTPIPGRGWSSPVAWGSRIFLTTAVPAGSSQSLHALGLDAETGKIAWDVTVFDHLKKGETRLHHKNSYASPTPITDGTHVFVHFGAQGTACLTLDGKIVWTTRELDYEPTHGPGGSPVLVDDALIFSCDGSDRQYVVALDTGSGTIRWKKDRPPCSDPKRFSFGTPLVIDLNGHKQVVSPGAHCVTAYDPKSGAEIWTVRYTGYSVVPRPVFGAGLVYLSTSFDSSVLLAIRPDGHGDITESHVAWKRAKSIPYTPSPLLIGEDLFLIDDKGIASCVEARSGRERWVHRIGGKFSASPVLADGNIFIQSEEGETIIYRPDPERYVEVARNNLKEPTLASPAVIGHALLIRTESALNRIEQR